MCQGGVSELHQTLSLHLFVDGLAAATEVVSVARVDLLDAIEQGEGSSLVEPLDDRRQPVEPFALLVELTQEPRQALGRIARELFAGDVGPGVVLLLDCVVDSLQQVSFGAVDVRCRKAVEQLARHHELGLAHRAQIRRANEQPEPMTGDPVGEIAVIARDPGEIVSNHSTNSSVVPKVIPNTTKSYDNGRATVVNPSMNATLSYVALWLTIHRGKPLIVRSNTPHDTQSISLSWSDAEQAGVEVVASTLPRDMTCPYCGAVRRPNGRRLVRFRDTPVDGESRFIDWRRQHYRCDHCGRASNETHPAFEKDHFITHRFSEWVKSKSATKSFAEIAKQAGMNHALLRRFFHSVVHYPETPRTALPKTLGIARVRLAGRLRPLLVNVNEGKVIDVLASDKELKSYLDKLAGSPEGGEIARIVRDIHFDLSGLLTSAKLLQLFPSLSQTIISSHSLAYEVVRMIISSCDPLFNSCAASECKSQKSVRHLFCRREDTLGKSAGWRRTRWKTKKHSPELFQAYEAKETFLRAWIDRNDLTDLPLILPRESAIKFDSVADLLKLKRNEVIPCFQEPALSTYQKWLDEEISQFETKGTHSFAAARLALLSKYGTISRADDADTKG